MSAQIADGWPSWRTPLQWYRMLVILLLLLSPGYAQDCGLGKAGEEEVVWPRDQAADPRVVGPGWFMEVDEGPLFLPLVLVVDWRLYQRWGANTSSVEERCRKLGRILGQLLSPLRLRVVVVGVEVWGEGDQVRLGPSADTTLARFLAYQSSKRWDQ